MTIYIVLLGFILAIAVAASFAFPDKKERENFILKASMIFIFAVFALKKFTVGSDISSYRRQYYLSESIPWDNFDYVYFEPGYILFMKMFSKAKIDFQIFMIVIYIFACIVMYYFIKKYSKNVTLSLVVFLCYQFFVFYLSGVRQTIAMSICLVAYMVLDKREGEKTLRILGFLGLVFLAASFHESAYIFILLLPFEFMKFNKFYLFAYIPIVLTSTILRPILLAIIKFIFPELITGGSVTVQGNFIFLALLGLLSIIAIIQYQPKEKVLAEHIEVQKDIDERFLFITVNINVSLIVLQLCFSGMPLLRSTMYFTLFLIPGITNVLKCFENKIEIIVTWVMLIGFIYMYFNETLLKNELNMLPYLFFWQ